MPDRPRLIEVAFPLKQTSLDSVHEKNVRHGHISTLHIWPARRPLAACRAALIATLLPDPGNKEERDRILERLAGRVVEVPKKKKLPSGKIEERKVEETVGGILHWGRESTADLEWFRQKIREAYDGRAPKVLDPFAGGGAIPLEAMRLGCEVTAIDINPVAWFLLKCTLEYPQKLAGQHRPLPKFALDSPEFMEQFFKGTGKLTKKQLERNLAAVQQRLFPAPDVDLAWHVRAWGWWVLQRAKADLAKYYPVVADKATVAYLWARTLKCKNCRATIPLLKTRWLCKKDKKRILLTMEPNSEKTGVVFGVQTDVPQVGGNAAQRREHDKRISAGTMSRSGVSCPCCNGAIMTSEDIRAEGLAGRMGTLMTAVVVDTEDGKEYRLPTAAETQAAIDAESQLDQLYSEIPFGLPTEPIPTGSSRRGGGSAFTVPLFGLDQWHKLFIPRQLHTLGTFVKYSRTAVHQIEDAGYSQEWTEAIAGYLALAVDRIADAGSSIAHWQPKLEANINTFQRFALPISWDFSEVNPTSGLTGSYQGALEWISLVVAHMLGASATPRAVPSVVNSSACLRSSMDAYDLVLTDPPYYDAIPYSDLMDFFYVWLRRTLRGLSLEVDDAFHNATAPKWDHEANDGELIDDAGRFGGDKEKSKKAYEDGMFRAFQACQQALKPDGQLVVVFANKQPDAWEALVSAIIRAGFVVDGSWPIQTERGVRTRSLSSAALASSVWLVCKKRPEGARPGWDHSVLSEMLERIQIRLRDFWDQDIHGPDFVWAAAGPALEIYSKYPVVKKANSSGEILTVSEFLTSVRRIVVDFVVGRVLTHNGGSETVSGLDDVTTYYILHRYDFGFEDAPVGASILYAISCGLTDRELTDRYDLLFRTGGSDEEPDEAEVAEAVEDEDAEIGTGSGSKVKLKTWSQRHRKSLGLDAGGAPAPLIDQAHRLMHLWKAGDAVKVDEFLDSKALRRQSLFAQLLQALIELAPGGSEERSILETISNHVAAKGPTAGPSAAPDAQQEIRIRGTIRVD
jgi:adenine-specific DNA methylase